MPRVGRHPMKKGLGLDTLSLKKLTIGSIVHIPDTTGFWKDSLKILDICISSIYQNTSQDFDLHIFDNGSCDEVKEYLIEKNKIGVIQHLSFSDKNLKKTGALNKLLRLSDGDYFAYLDSDALMLPGWLEASLNVINNFENVGQVTCIPIARCFDNPQDVINSLKKFKNIECSSSSDFIPEEFVKAHAISVGMDFEKYKVNRLSGREDIKITKNDVTAYYGSVDFQFITSREVIESVLPLPTHGNDLRGDDIYKPIWENELSKKGLMMLSTEDYLVHHMGNRIPNLKDELPWLELGLESFKNEIDKTKNMKLKKGNRLLSSTRLRRLIKRIHHWTYDFLYEK